MKPPYINEHLFRLGKFSIVGISNSVLTYGIYALCLLVSGPHIAIAIGYLAGMLNSYIWNTRWTFHRNLKAWKQVFRFLFVNLILLALNELGYILWSLALHPPLLIQAVNTVVMTGAGYLLNSIFVYPDTKAGDAEAGHEYCVE